MLRWAKRKKQKIPQFNGPPPPPKFSCPFEVCDIIIIQFFLSTHIKRVFVFARLSISLPVSLSTICSLLSVAQFIPPSISQP